MQFPPLFSILIANYNNGKYLMDAIESVRQQTYTNWEIILVDDASTDNSKDLYETLRSDQRIHIFLNDNNHGCGYTKRRCADLATGELCGFLDPDDALTQDALQVMVEQHALHSEASVVGSCYWCVDEQMNKQWHTTQWIYSEGKDYLTDFDHLRPIAFAAYKNEKYHQTEGINPNLKRAVDVDMYVKLEEFGHIVMIPDILYLYRVHEGNLSIGHNKALYWHVCVIQDACRRRSLDPESVVTGLLDHMILPLLENRQKILDSQYYKLGKRLLMPFEKIQRKVKKNI